MGRMIENPRYEILSVRVTDEDADFVRRLAKKKRTSVSEIVRQAILSLRIPE